MHIALEKSMHSVNTRYEDPKDLNFTYTGRQVTWLTASGHRAWSNLYKPTEECLRWHALTEEKGAIFAIGSQHGVFGFVRVEERGRVVRTIPGTGGTFHGARGLLASITFSIDSEYASDIHTEECWLVERPAA